MDSLNNVFGLKMFAASQLQKSRYWSRKDGTKWWRNPNTDAIEPYHDTIRAAEQVSPKTYMGQYTPKEQAKLSSVASPEFKALVDNFDSLSPEEQERVLELTELPEVAFLANNHLLGGPLGINESLNPEKGKPLSKKLMEDMLDVDFERPFQEIREEVLDKYDDAIANLSSVAKLTLGVQASDAIFDASRVAIPYMLKAIAPVPSGTKTPDGYITVKVDDKLIEQGLIEFEEELFGIIKGYMNG